MWLVVHVEFGGECVEVYAGVLHEEAGALEVGNGEAGAALGDDRLVIVIGGGLEVGGGGGEIGGIAARSEEVVEEAAVEC